jgi:hypothetical protein
VIDYALAQFETQLSKQLESFSGRLDGARHRKAELETELRKLTTAVAVTGHSTFLLEGIADRERELRSLTDQLLSGERGSLQRDLADLRQFVHSRLSDVMKLLYSDVGRARAELAKHVSSITMCQTREGRDGFYIASGEWNLLGNEWPRAGTVNQHFRMVAGGGFEPPTFGL